jgi:diguanylate cyclase
MTNEMQAPLQPNAHSPESLDARRAGAIVGRVRLFAGVFTALTLAWIAVDAAFLDAERLAALAAARAAAAIAFAALAAASRISAPTLREARSRVVLLFAIASSLFLAAQAILPPLFARQSADGLALSYASFPFLLAAGIAAFPLMAAEAAGLAILVLATVCAALAIAAAGPQLLWPVLIIAVTAGFAATSQARLMAELVEQAIRDPLTGCLRRESGAGLLDMQLRIAARQHAPLAVLFADIDRFKAVNDEFGHEVGDQVLAGTARALRDIMRDSDVLVRWGGEEFVAVLPHTTQTEAVTLIRRLSERGAGTLPDGRAVTVSIGVAEYVGDRTASSAELVALADRRMYLAKQAGRNRFVIDASGEAYPLLPSAASSR